MNYGKTFPALKEQLPAVTAFIEEELEKLDCPIERQDPDVEKKAEDDTIGGLGIFMVKKTMDNVEYKYEDGCNVLTICKTW